MDTTLTKKGFYKYHISGEVCSRNFESKVALLAHNYDHLPTTQIVYFEAIDVKDRKQIQLKWKLNYQKTIRAVEIYRKSPGEKKFKYLATVPENEFSFIDNVTISNEFYNYQLVVHDFFNNKYKSVIVGGLTTFKEKPYPPQDPSIQVEKAGFTLKWRRLGENTIGYRIYRKLGNADHFRLLDEAIYNDVEWVTYRDTTEILKKHETVAYKIHSLSDGFQESEKGPVLLGHHPVRKNIPPPKEVSLLVDSLGQYRMIWTAMEDNPDIGGYLFFGISAQGDTSKFGIFPVERNYADFPANIGNRFTHLGVKSVDNQGTESEMASLIKIPAKQFIKEDFIVKIHKEQDKLILSWTPVKYAGLKNIYLYKSKNGGRIRKLSTLPPDALQYTDNNIKKGDLYQYYFIAVDTQGEETPLNDGELIRY